MWRKTFETLERNKTWRVFRQAKAVGDILAYFGVSTWVVSGAAVASGALTGWYVSLQIWGRVVLGLGTAVALLAIAVLCSLLLSGDADPLVSEQTPDRRVKRAINIVSVGVAIALAGVMSYKPAKTKTQTPTVAQTSAAATKKTVDTHADAKPQGEPTHSAPKTTAKSRRSPVPQIPPINQGPCGVVQVGGTGNQATGGNCTVLPHAEISMFDTNENYALNGQYVSRHDVLVAGAVVPKLTATVHADSLLGISLEQQPVGFWTTEPIQDGATSTTVNNASGRLILRVRVSQPDTDIKVKFDCDGADCGVKYLHPQQSGRLIPPVEP